MEAVDSNPKVKENEISSGQMGDSNENPKKKDKSPTPSESKSSSVSSGRANKRKSVASNVFPAGCMGCTEEEEIESRFLDAYDASRDKIGHMDKLPRKRRSESEHRNPLTGAGIEVEVRKPSSRRKDGNPLLGTGYEVEEKFQFW